MLEDSKPGIGSHLPLGINSKDYPLCGQLNGRITFLGLGIFSYIGSFPIRRLPHSRIPASLPFGNPIRAPGFEGWFGKARFKALES